MPGEIQRVSVAVLLNQQALGLDADGVDPAVASQEIVSNFEQLILAGAGLNTERGDSLTGELMPFQALAVPDLATAPGLVQTLIQT